MWRSNPPEPRVAVCATQLSMIKDETVVLVQPDGTEHRHHYAVSNVYTINGVPYVDILHESEFWGLRLVGRYAEPSRWPAASVWLE